MTDRDGDRQRPHSCHVTITHNSQDNHTRARIHKNPRAAIIVIQRDTRIRDVMLIKPQSDSWLTFWATLQFMFTQSTKMTKGKQLKGNTLYTPETLQINVLYCFVVMCAQSFSSVKSFTRTNQSEDGKIIWVVHEAVLLLVELGVSEGQRFTVKKNPQTNKKKDRL